MADNNIFKLEEVRIKKYAVLELKKGRWPMRNSAIAFLVKQHVYRLQREIALLSKQGLQQEVFTFMDSYIFSISNRLATIDSLSKPVYGKTFRGRGFVIETDADRCLLLNLSKYTTAKERFTGPGRRVYISRENVNRGDSSNINILLDTVLQRMLANLLTSYYNIEFCPTQSEFYKDCSRRNIVVQLHEHLLQKPAEKILILADVEVFYNNISWDALQEVRVPTKFKNLVEI